LLAFHSELLSN